MYIITLSLVCELNYVATVIHLHKLLQKSKQHKTKTLYSSRSTHTTHVPHLVKSQNLNITPEIFDDSNGANFERVLKQSVKKGKENIILLSEAKILALKMYIKRNTHLIKQML